MNEQRRPPAPPLGRREGSGPVPLTVSQRRPVTTGDPVLGQRSPMLMRLTGRINSGALERAFALVQDRHEALRVRFLDIGGTAGQVFDGAVQPLGRAELSGSEEARWDGLADIVRRPSREANGGPGIALTLAMVNEREAYLAGTAHRAVWDGRSFEIFWTELVAAYDAGVLGLAIAPPMPRLQFGDYAAWEAAVLTEEALAENRAYWERTLALARPMAPAAGPSPRENLRVEIEGAVFQGLVRLAREEGATTAQLLITLAAVAVARWADRDGSLIGHVISGRPTAAQDTIGCFTQLRPAFIDLSDRPPLRTIVGRGRQAVVGGMDVRRPPPDDLMERLDVGGVAINLRTGSAPAASASAPLVGARLERVDAPERLTLTPMKGAIGFSLYQDEAGVRGRLSCAADRIDAGEAKRLAHTLHHLAEEAAKA